MKNYQQTLKEYRDIIYKMKDCPYRILQPYDKGEGYYGCSKNGFVPMVSYYYNCNYQCARS